MCSLSEQNPEMGPFDLRSEKFVFRRMCPNSFYNERSGLTYDRLWSKPLDHSLKTLKRVWQRFDIE